MSHPFRNIIPTKGEAPFLKRIPLFLANNTAIPERRFSAALLPLRSPRCLGLPCSPLAFPSHSFAPSCLLAPALSSPVFTSVLFHPFHFIYPTSYYPYCSSCSAFPLSFVSLRRRRSHPYRPRALFPAFPSPPHAPFPFISLSFRFPLDFLLTPTVITFLPCSLLF